MKRSITIFLLLISILSFSRKDVYILVWGSSLTKTGAGHCSIAFKDSVGFHYFSHYPNSIVGTIDTFLLNFNSLQSFDKEVLGIQRSNPNLILKFEVSNKEFINMKLFAKRSVKRSWTLFVFNCADFVKGIFRNSDYDTGLAFGISTPVELVKDIKDHNVNHFLKGNITTVKGFVYPFLLNEPRAVPFTLRKWIGF